jgi:hypothetical protein
MNDNETFNIGASATPEEPVVYSSYYNHQPRKKPLPLIIGIIVIAIVALISLWLSGFFTPINSEAEYNKLVKRVCNSATKYTTDNYKNLISGKIIYIKVKTLVANNLIEAELTNYLTGETIPTSTDIRLEVLPSGSLECYGFYDPTEDKEKPSITLNGEAIISTTVGQTVTDPGVKAIDNMDGDISDEVSRSGNVDSSKAGTYIVTYVVTDRAKNTSDTIQRTYVIR